MEEIIERLRKEKKEYNNSWFELGKEEGLDFAKTASFTLLLDIIDCQCVYDLNVYDEHKTENDLILKEYFDKVREQKYEPLFNNYTWAFFGHGWIDGVREFWNGVKDKL